MMRCFWVVAVLLCVGCGSAAEPVKGGQKGADEVFDTSLDTSTGAADAATPEDTSVAEEAESEEGLGRGEDADTGPGAHITPDVLEEDALEGTGDASALDSTMEAPLYPTLPEELEATIYSKMDDAKVPGLAACVIKDDAIYWCGGFGKANLALDQGVSEHTPFLLASISKTFTSALVLQLRDEGLVTFADDVDSLLGWDLAHPLHSAPVTMHQLLTHTSGIDDNWGAMGAFYGMDEDPPMTLQEAVEGYFQPEGPWYDAEANFTPDAPGTVHHYSNMAVALAGHLVEKASGKSFAAQCEQRLFEPLGLENTGIFLADFESTDRLAMPYEWKGDAYVPAGHYTFADYPDGGIRSSAYDLARFLLMHIRGGELEGVQVLAPESVDAMLSPQAPVASGEQGWIWIQLFWGGQGWWGHNGAEKGVFTEMFFRVSDKMGFVVLTNGDADDPYPIYDIEDALLAWAEGDN